MLGRWWPPAAWSACILVATWIPGARLPHIVAPAGADKVVHFAFFAVLGFLVLVAMRPRDAWRAVPWVLLVIALFGALDEFVQQFIPGRDMELFDWIADVSGAARSRRSKRPNARRSLNVKRSIVGSTPSPSS